MKEEKIKQIILGAVTFILAIIIDKMTNISILYKFLIYLVPYSISSFESFEEALEGIKEKDYFNEHLLMIIASMGAMIIGFLPNSKPEFIEGIFVMLFFQVGELFEIIAEGKSERSIENLLSIKADYANILKDNRITKVAPNTVHVNDILVIKAGEKVPLDGVIIDGETVFNTVAITGEAKPSKKKVNDIVYSGFINMADVIQVKVTKEYEDSTANRIIKLVKDANEKKSVNEKFITKFAKIYTPIVIVLALVMTIVPTIFHGNIVTSLQRALTFLVISCPCALVISVPLAYFGGIGAASKKGVLFKGSNYLDSITKIDTMVFDKTGTLTEGVFEVSAIHEEKLSKDELIHLVYHVEEYSHHPIAESLKQYYLLKKRKCQCEIKNIKEISGMGIVAKVNNMNIYVGNDKLMEKIGIDYKKCDMHGTIIHVATKKEYLGHIVISDYIKKDSYKLIDYLNEEKINVVMLTGDNHEEACTIAKKLGISTYYDSLLPEEKIKKIEELNSKKVAFVGDGINDALALTKSDIGISFGGIGSDIAIEASDVIIMNDKLTNLIDAIDIAKKTRIIAIENICFSIIIKVLILLLSAIGLTNMFLAVFADVGVTILAVLNSFRILK